jgi:inorganic triphosphatase YgiF
MLGSCAQWQAEQELRQSQQAQAQAQAAATAANDDAQCQSYGAAPGSQSYIQCRMNLDSQRAQMQQMIAGRLLGQMLNH